MIVTEAEAERLWCPHGRAVLMFEEGNSLLPSCNRVIPFGSREYMERELERMATGVSRCMGSKCMAWRWERMQSAAAAASPYQARGFCGLSGEERA